MEIRQVPINMLNPATYNPRKDLQPGDTQYEKLKKSIEEFGYVDPIIWNERSGNVIGGHQRLKILVDQGADAVDVSVVNLGPVQEKALNLALNKISGVWDMEKLGTVFQDIQSELTDLSVTGFSSIEITELYQGNSIDIDTLFSPAPTADQKPKPPEQVQCPRCHEWFEVAG